MKKIVPHILILILFFLTIVANAQIGINTVTPNALLEIKSSSQVAPTNTDGIIIPRVDAFSAVNPTAAQQGMMVYLTTTSGTNLPGFYYWDNITLSWIGFGIGNKGFQHYIGELYGGGIVISVWKVAGVEHGLIASLKNMTKLSAPTDQFIWTTSAKAAIAVPSPFASSPYDGQINTTAILAQNGNALDTAAYICDQYSYGGFSDWYLPAIWELESCYSTADIVNAILGPTDGFKFGVNVIYWSSTERDAGQAYYKTFNSNYSYYVSKDINKFYVRAVRRF